MVNVTGYGAVALLANVTGKLVNGLNCRDIHNRCEVCDISQPQTHRRDRICSYCIALPCIVCKHARIPVSTHARTHCSLVDVQTLSQIDVYLRDFTNSAEGRRRLTPENVYSVKHVTMYQLAGGDGSRPTSTEMA